MRYFAGMSGLAPRPDAAARFLRLAALLLWASALLYFSLSAAIRPPSGLLGWDKLNHFAAYAVLALLLIRVLTTCRPPTLRLLTVVWVACFAYGLVIEGLQWAMGVGRQFESGDLLANGLGALVCVIFCLVLGRFSRMYAG